MTSVTLKHTSPKTVLQDYHTLLTTAKIASYLKPKIPTILKLNLSWSLYYPACSTQPWQLEGTLQSLQKQNYQNLIPVENETVVTRVLKGARHNKWLRILKNHSFQFQPLTKEKWIAYKPKTPLLALDKIFKDEYKIPEVFLNKNVIHFPTLKTHGHTTMTGAMKNAFGGLITKRRHHCHKMIHEVLVDLLAIQKEIHPAQFAITDGTVAGDGAGPRTMIPRQTNILLASHDQVAIDAIAAQMMGFDPLKIKFIKLAHDRGLGIGDPKQILINGDPIKRFKPKFKTNKSPVIFFDQMFRKGPLSFVEPWLFHSKLFHSAIFGSAFYHDYVWYPTIGKHRIRKFNKTSWGKLWQTYKI